jgi:hypothetical protein
MARYETRSHVLRIGSKTGMSGPLFPDWNGFWRGIHPRQTNGALGLVRLYRIAPGIVPANQSLYKLEKQSG